MNIEVIFAQKGFRIKAQQKKAGEEDKNASKDLNTLISLSPKTKSLNPTDDKNNDINNFAEAQAAVLQFGSVFNEDKCIQSVMEKIGNVNLKLTDNAKLQMLAIQQIF